MLAKGLLLMKEIGFSKMMMNDLKEKIDEIKYLEKKIGFTGKKAIPADMFYNEKGIAWINNLLQESNV